MTSDVQFLAGQERKPPLSIRAEFWPMGAAVSLETNSIAVYTAASRLWSAYPAGDLNPPVRVCVSVSPGPPLAAGKETGTSPFRNLLTLRPSEESTAVADLDAGVGFAEITDSLADDESALIYHVLEPLTYILLNCRHFLPIHAACVALDGRAAILCGDSGVGKTSFAYACASRGWTYLSGDATHLVRNSETLRVAGRPFEIRFRNDASRIFPELAAFRVVHRPNGKRDYEIDTRELPILLGHDAEAACLVYLDRREGEERTALLPINRDFLISSLMEPIRYGGEKIRRDQMDAVYRLSQLPAYRLSYRDHESAQCLLRMQLKRARHAAPLALSN